MIIGPQLFESYLLCPTKCWLRSRGEPPAGNSYTDWVNARNKTYIRNGLNRLLAKFGESDCAIAPPLTESPKNFKGRLAINVCWRTKEVESCLQAVERVPAEGRGRPPIFIPYQFEASNKITQEHKLLLAFDALMLSELLGREVRLGKIVHGDNYATLNVKIVAFSGEARNRIKDNTTLLRGNAPPEIVLNRHCGHCEFQNRCLAQAREKDDLSLLTGMSEKDRKKLHGKGIFTVTQLSYTFRPRRRRSESRDKQEKYHHSLRALAIRENKIHVVGIPALKLGGTRVFMDIEGMPDRDFYCLIGLRVETDEGPVQHSLWANTESDERLIWSTFLGILAEIANPQLIHYGSYETTFLRRMCDRYGRPPDSSEISTAINHPINILLYVYAQVYFPTYSNGLKEIAGYLGFRWSGSPSSGLESILWRHRWETSMEPALKQALIDYNRQDCEAIALLTKTLVAMQLLTPSDSNPAQQNIIVTSEMKRENPYGFRTNQFVLPDLEIINKAAYWITSVTASL